ncbi:MAG TPA: serine/threonine-protein kinase, partial [Byssovorax sp.]
MREIMGSAGSPELTTGAVFHRRYEVCGRMSAGGMGAVYEVLDRQTRRRRALKVMLPSLVQSAEFRERFALEATVTAEIDSDHLVEIVDAGVDEESGAPFIAMELLKGEDLGRVVASSGALAPTEVVRLLDQVARALEATHALGIVHRDLKPENLFLARRADAADRVKLLDFGIAKVLATGGEASRTTKSVGTPLYMAPEQLQGSDIGPRTDLYALGHIAFTLLVGAPFFFEESTRGDGVFPVLTAALAESKDAATARASRAGKSLPGAFDAWFARATAHEAERRFGSARAMIAELAAALDVEAPSLPASGERRPTAAPDGQARVRVGSTSAASDSGPTVEAETTYEAAATEAAPPALTPSPGERARASAASAQAQAAMPSEPPGTMSGSHAPSQAPPPRSRVVAVGVAIAACVGCAALWFALRGGSTITPVAAPASVDADRAAAAPSVTTAPPSTATATVTVAPAEPAPASSASASASTSASTPTADSSSAPSTTSPAAQATHK